MKSKINPYNLDFNESSSEISEIDELTDPEHEDNEFEDDDYFRIDKIMDPIYDQEECLSDYEIFDYEIFDSDDLEYHDVNECLTDYETFDIDDLEYRDVIYEYEE